MYINWTALTGYNVIFAFYLVTVKREIKETWICSLYTCILVKCIHLAKYFMPDLLQCGRVLLHNEELKWVEKENRVTATQ